MGLWPCLPETVLIVDPCGRRAQPTVCTPTPGQVALGCMRRLAEQKPRSKPIAILFHGCLPPGSCFEITHLLLSMMDYVLEV